MLPHARPAYVPRYLYLETPAIIPRGWKELPGAGAPLITGVTREKQQSQDDTFSSFSFIDRLCFVFIRFIYYSICIRFMLIVLMRIREVEIMILLIYYNYLLHFGTGDFPSRTLHQHVCLHYSSTNKQTMDLDGTRSTRESMDTNTCTETHKILERRWLT